MRPTAIHLAFLYVTLQTVAGCSDNASEPVSESPPEAPSFVETPIGPSTRSRNVAARWTDFGIDDAAGVADGSHAIDPTPSRGRFPTGLSVVRLSAVEDVRAGRRGLEFVPVEPERSMFWNHFVDDLPPIREVTMLGTLGIDPRGATWQDFLHESLQLDCDLCLMYTLVYDTTADAEFAAVLWDASQRIPLASFRSPFVMPPALREECEERDDLSRRECDPEYLAEARLRTMVAEQLWDLAERDNRVAATRPSPWRSNVPLYPRDYPRYRDPRWLDMNRPHYPPPPAGQEPKANEGAPIDASTEDEESLPSRRGGARR